MVSSDTQYTSTILMVLNNSAESLEGRTSIPVPQLVEFIELCLQSTFFQFGDEYLEQTDGAAMVSPLSPVVANLFVEDLEEKAIRSASPALKTWFRYVDNTFVLWPHGEAQLHTFHQHLNQQNPNIQFTMELEKEGCIPFLDVLVIREKDHLATTVYRNPPIPTDTSPLVPTTTSVPLQV